MDQNELREYFRQKKQLSIQDSDSLNNTINECKRIIRTEKSRMNYHMSFMEFLADTFHRDGASLIIVQIVVLLVTCLIIHESSGTFQIYCLYLYLCSCWQHYPHFLKQKDIV